MILAFRNMFADSITADRDISAAGALETVKDGKFFDLWEWRSNSLVDFREACLSRTHIMMFGDQPFDVLSENGSIFVGFFLISSVSTSERPSTDVFRIFSAG